MKSKTTPVWLPISKWERLQTKINVLRTALESINGLCQLQEEAQMKVTWVHETAKVYLEAQAQLETLSRFEDKEA